MDSGKEISHQPVLVKEAVLGLRLKPGAVVLDATVGLGGHAGEILHVIGPTGRLICLDRDQDALRLAQTRLEAFKGQTSFVHGHFGDISAHMDRIGVVALDGALFDLGVSSMQLDLASRGFSFRSEGPLDMRMDRTQELSAADLVNTISVVDLTDLLRTYGQEQWAGRIAQAIVRRRPFMTTNALAETIRKAVPGGATSGRSDPATRSFQAIRIAVNRELELLPLGIRQAIGRLKPGGRIVVLSYHSLEHRIIRVVFRDQTKLGLVEIVTHKPVTPSEEEVRRNSRARSAQMRVAMRSSGNGS